jgi:hypothetical protein
MSYKFHLSFGHMNQDEIEAIAEDVLAEVMKTCNYFAQVDFETAKRTYGKRRGQKISMTVENKSSSISGHSGAGSLSCKVKIVLEKKDQ